MVRPVPVFVPLCLAAAAIALSGCHASGCREDDQACAVLSQDTGGSSSGTDTSSTGLLPTGTSRGETTVDETSATTAETTTTTVPAVCGDGVVAGDEPCDDGNQDNSDECLNGCVAPSCGDTFVHFGVEECDDGNTDDSDDCVKCRLAKCGDGHVHPPEEACDDGVANSDLIYGGCTSKCQPGAHCGDGKLNGPEDCDDQNSDPKDGCLAGCVEATSCKKILELVPDATTGKYRLWPAALGGDIDVVVWCDMDSDGGGYTFLKIDGEVDGANDKGAKAAELACQTYGMHLLIPRTPAHVKSAHTFATTANIPPIGGGKIASGTEYLSILSIFPKEPMKTCDGGGLNSVDCPGWRAGDDHEFWVTDIPVPGEPSEEHCAGCSMLYKWNADGSLKSYTTFPAGEGASSFRFICDIGDKY